MRDTSEWSSLVALDRVGTLEKRRDEQMKHCVLILSVFVCAGFTSADVLEVPGEYMTISNAIAVASNDDTILVDSGVYEEMVSFGSKRLNLVSVSGAENTTISKPRFMSGTVVILGDPGNSGSTISGFTIENGFAGGNGGGLSISNGADAQVSDCIFLNNESLFGHGGGAYVAEDSVASFISCTFRSNIATEGNGGGLCIDANGDFTVDRCRFEGNSSANGGGAQVGASGSLSKGETFPRITNSVFTGNTATENGGGAKIVSAASGITSYSGGVYGCTFSTNTAEYGGAVYGGVVLVPNGRVNVVDCILANNVGGYDTVSNGDFNVSTEPDFFYSCVDFLDDSDALEADSINSSPRFVSELGPDGAAGTGDEILKLLPGSLCIDAGYVYGDSAILNGDFDVAGKPRLIDSTLREDTGTTEGPTPIVDMGAHEFDEGDINGSVAIWTGEGSSSLLAEGNWFEAVTPDQTISTWFDGDDVVDSATVLSSTTIGTLYVNSGAWQIENTSPSATSSISVAQEGKMGKEPGSIYIGPFDGQEGSLALENVGLFCDALAVVRGEFSFGPGNATKATTISANSVLIASTGPTVSAMFAGEGSVVRPTSTLLPFVWNLGTVKPTGLLAIEGNYYQSGATLFPGIVGSLLFDLESLDQQLAVAGTAQLGGPVRFEFDPMNPPGVNVDDVLMIVSATEGFIETEFSFTVTSGATDGMFFTLSYAKNAQGTSGVSATVQSAAEILLGGGETDITDAIAKAILVDLDGDTFRDLVLTVPAADPADEGFVVVLFNEGLSGGGSWDGFENFAGATIVVEVGKAPAGLDAGDFDNDGDIDLAVANSGDGTVSLLLNTIGSGTPFDIESLESAPHLPALERPLAEPLDVYIGDLDSDGNLDLAITNAYDGTVVTYRNATSPFTGGFGGMDDPDDSDPGGTITVFDPGDAESKDRDDSVVGSSKSSDSAKVGKSTGGGFGAAIELDWESYPTDDDPVDISRGDLNNDNDDDFVTVNRAAGTVSVLLGDKADGQEAADTFVIGDQPISVDIGDLDGDGDLDIATICENDSGDRVLRVIQNMLIESGTSQFALVVLSSDDLEGQEPFLLRVADIDNDASQIEDVVALTSSTSLIGGAEGFNAILSLGNTCLGDVNNDGQVDAADLGLLLSAWGLDGPTDLNEDGLTDAADLGLILAAWGPCGVGST